MARELVDDELWEIVRPLLPVRRRRKTHPGRKPLDDRRVLTDMLFVLQSGIPWETLPQEIGVRLRYNLLAPGACLAKGWRMAQAAPRAAGQITWSRQT